MSIMTIDWKRVYSSCAPVLGVMVVFGVSLALSIPAPLSVVPSPNSLSSRNPRTLNMTMGMNIFKDMLQNGMAFRPVPPPFPSLKNLFKVNGTQWRWVPLGSIIFNNNGKIIGG